MANVEILKIRLAKAQADTDKKQAIINKYKAAIDKLTKIIEENGWSFKDWDCRRGTPEHHKAFDTIWTYRTKISNLQDAEKALINLQEKVKKYEDGIKIEEQKMASRNISVVMKFLEIWKENAIKFYNSKWKEYNEKAIPEYNAKVGTFANKSEEIKYEKKFKMEWECVMQFTGYEISWEQKMMREVEKEKNRKYDDLVKRVKDVVGEITDASNLSIDERSNLNGRIYGTDGECEVDTVSAGGYNIQCFHFRTLVKKI